MGSATRSAESGPAALAADQKAGSLSGSNGSAKRKGSRREQRVFLEIPVRVYGWGANNEPFHQETSTVNVSSYGALIILTDRVSLDQRLILTHPKTQEEVMCRVASLGQNEQGRTEVGVEFINPAPKFWRIAFPPEDWNPAERKLPTSRADRERFLRSQSEARKAT